MKIFILALFDWKSNNRVMYTLYMCCLFFLFSNSSKLVAQSVPLESSIHVNFGVDADIYSGLVSFSPIVGTNSDDYFEGASGMGVIDVSDAATIAQLASGANVGAEFRQKFPVYTVVPGPIIGDTWIDAVYIRDQRTNGGNMDMNVFGGGADKNFDNPTTWIVKSGDVPQKNDIIDVYAHLRRDSDAVFPNTDDEWAFAAASTRSDNGTSYLDFEYFRKKVTFNPATQSLVTAGTECGHTAYDFDPVSGAVLIHGDVILSTNYTNGGSVADIRLYAWIDKNDFPTNAAFTAFNIKIGRPFNFGDEDGNFEFHACSESGSGNYGYARIVLRDDLGEETERAIYAQVNTTASVAAPPWGTIAPGGELTDVYISPTFAEFGINATLLGLDTRTTGGECQAPLGSVIVKTRSSDSFTAELKDLAGPFDLGDTPEYTVSIADPEDLTCTVDTVTLTATAQPPGTYSYVWYKDDVEIQSGALNTLEVTEPGTYFVVATIIIAGQPGCSATSTEVIVDQDNTPPEPPTTDGDERCGPGEVTLTTSCTSGTPIWYDAAEDGNVVAVGGDGTSYTLNLAVTTSFWVSCSTAGQNGCESARVEVTGTINPIPVATATGGVLSCNVTTVQLMGSATSANPTPVFTYAWTGPDSYVSNEQNPTVSVAGNYTLTVVDTTNGCSDTDVAVVSGDFDITPPSITCPPATSVQCIEDVLDPDISLVVASDNRGGPVTVTFVDDVSNGETCPEIITRTYRAQDECGNVATCTQLITVDDTMIPIIKGINDITLEGCNTPWPEVVSTTWTDNCSAGGTINGVAGTVMNSDDGCFQYRDYAFNVTDDCLNDAAEVLVRVTRSYDETAPVIVDPDDITLEACNAPWPEVVSTTWTDNCSAGGTINGVAGTIVTSDDGCFQYRDYAFNVTDDCLNDAAEVLVRVTRSYDETAPVIVDPDDITLEACNAPWPEVVSTTWTDNCSAGGTINGVAGTIMTSDDGCFQYRDYAFNVTDDCLNDAAEVLVRVTRSYDETAPVIVDPDDITLEACNAPWPEVVSTTWTDNCSAGGTINGVAGTIVTSDDGCFQYRDYAFNVTDDCLNDAAEVLVRVTRSYDETAPVIVDPDDITLEACNAPWPEVVSTTWTDNCSAGGTINGVAGTIMTSDDGCFQYRDYAFNVTDDCLNDAAEVLVRVTRSYDETAPVIVDPDDITLEACNAPWPEVVSTTWTDNCSAGGTINGVAGTIMTSDDGCFQYRDYAFNVTDDCLNDAAEVLVRVTRSYDETAPVIVDPDDITLEACNAPWPEVVSTTWTDNCSAGGTINGVAGTIMTSDDGCFQYRDYAFNVTDDCLNDAAEVLVRVTRSYDETAPVIVDPDDITLEACNAPWPEVVSTTWTDNCSAGGTINGVAGTVMTSDDGCTQYRDYTFNVTDDCQNSAAKVLVRVNRTYDVTAPTIILPEAVEIECNEKFPSSLTASWTDNCSDGGFINAKPSNIVTENCTQYADYVFEVIDDCGNPATETLKIQRQYDEMEQCETAFARDPESNICFIPDFNRWGWTNYYAGENAVGEAHVLDLYAGAAHCNVSNRTPVGTVTVDYSGGEVWITYNINAGYGMSEAHVYVGCEKYPTKKERYTVAPGQYNFNPGGFDGYASNFTVGPIAANGAIYVIAHAVVCEEVCRCSDSDQDGGTYSPPNAAVGCAKPIKSGIAQGNFSLFPNPFRREINVNYEYEFDTKVKIEIIDIHGTIIKTYQNDNYTKDTLGEIKIDLSNALDRLLFVKITTDRGSVVKKIVSDNKK